MTMLNVLAFFDGVLGCILIAAAWLLSGGQPVDDPPAHLSGELEARAGALAQLAGVLFLIIGGLGSAFGLDPKGWVVLLSASLVLTGWGAGRVFVASGGTKKPAQWLFLSGLWTLMLSATVGVLNRLLSGL
jgi:hypothetical protein